MSRVHNSQTNIILISGASSGIGKNMATYLAKKGNVVYAGARKDTDLQDLNRIDNIFGIKLDVSIQDEINRVIETIRQKHGHLDVLINNAGIIGWGAIMNREISYFKKVLDVNLWGMIRLIQQCYPLLKKSNNYQ